MKISFPWSTFRQILTTRDLQTDVDNEYKEIDLDKFYGSGW